jgi:hypothetical protein
MNLYKIVATRTTDSETPDTETHWVGSQADAAAKRKALLAEGWTRREIETLDVNVPTDKGGLLAFLNEQR